ncbi:MAG: hypothetical protein JNK04_14090, partial [Myxococcales bacterium]|nr:hypothetical protein [Myxococcales bacterium]
GNGGDGGAGGQGGAPSQCEETCAMLEACGQPLCGQGGLFDCSVEPPTHNTCWLDCVSESSCGEVNAFITGGNAPVLEACMGACDSGAICKQCVADPAFPGNDCSAEIAACGADPACSPWVTCAGGCATKACMDGCDAMYPAGAPLEAVYDCICNVGYCGDVCASVFTCPGP